MKATMFALSAMMLGIAGRADAQEAAPLTNFIGASARVEPYYDGGDSYRVLPLPVADVALGPVFARTTRGIGEAGARITLVPGITAGVQAAFEIGRDAADTPLLARNGFADVSTTASVGGFVEGRHGNAGWLVRVRRLFDEQGVEVDARASYAIARTRRFQAAAYAGTTWANGQAMRTDFGVGSQQAIRGELAQYAPGAGFRDAYVGVGGSYAIARRWALVGIAEGKTLVGKAADSPITPNNAFARLTLGLAFRF